MEMNLLWIVIGVLAGVLIVWVFYSVLKKRTASHTTLGNLQSDTKARAPLQQTTKAPIRQTPAEPNLLGARAEPDSRPNAEWSYISVSRHELLVMIMGDEKVADRLIAYEQRLNPTGNLEDWIERAKERLRRDRQ